MNILITGASGFIGSFIVEEALRQGFETWAAVRATSSRKYLQDERIRFVLLDMQDPAKLRSQLLECKAQMGGKGWDYVVHAAGLIKSLYRRDFFRTNAEGTKNLVDALRATGMTPRRFVLLSSLGIFGAIREKPVRKATADNPWIYSPILLSDEPKPNTAYGESKLAAERYLTEQQDFPYTILRPTGVYGPREHDYFLLAQSIKKHIDVAVGMTPQEITFVYVLDVVQAVFKSMKAPQAEGKSYFLSDGHVYSSRSYSDLVQKYLGNPWVLHLRFPLWILKVACWVSDRLCRMTGTLNTLNDDRYNILSQRNWQCETGPAAADFGFAPEYTLERGVEASIRWFKQEGWL